ADPRDGFSATHVWHTQVHERYVRSMLAETLDRLAGVGGFRYQAHIGLSLEDRGDSLAYQRMVIDAQYVDQTRVAHIVHLFMLRDRVAQSHEATDRTRRPSRAPAAHAAAPPVAVGELRSQRELYFRAGARSAPDLQFGADVPCALAHPRQAPMSRPP